MSSMKYDSMKYEDMWLRPYGVPVSGRPNEIYEFLQIFQEDVKLKGGRVHIGRNIFCVNQHRFDDLKREGLMTDSVAVHPADGGRLKNDGFKYFQFDSGCPNALGLPNFWYRWTTNHFYVIWNQ